MWRTDQIVWPTPWTTKAPDMGRNYIPRQSLPLAAALRGDDIVPQSQCFLFRFPPEIRKRIYQMALQTYPDPTRPYPTRGTLWRPNLSGPRRIDTSLLQTCRAIYIETWALPVMQTTLVIHEGSAEDLPEPKFQRQRLYVRPGQPIFFLQAWQVLLLRHIEVTFQQIRLEDKGLEDWLRRVDGARRQSRSLVQELADEAQAAGDDGAAKDFVETSLLGVEIRSLTMRMNRRDWWTWTNTPPPADADLDWEAKRGYILRLQRPVSPHAVSTHSPEHEEDMKFLSDDLTFTLVLETFGPKLNQLLRVVEAAKEWTFETSLQQPEGGGANRLMVWDGHIGDQSWERHSSASDRLRWLKRPDATSSRVEVRTIRFVPRTIV